MNVCEARYKVHTSYKKSLETQSIRGVRFCLAAESKSPQTRVVEGFFMFFRTLVRAVKRPKMRYSFLYKLQTSYSIF